MTDSTSNRSARGVRFGLKYRFLLSFGLMTAALLATGYVGLHGFEQLRKSLDYLTDTAWEASDAAMEGTIELERQMLLVDQLLRDSDGSGANAGIQEARKSVVAAFDRMRAQDLVPPGDLARIQAAQQGYLRDLDVTLVANSEMLGARGKFQTATESFLAISDVVEARGDGLVEKLADEPHRGISWADGLESVWEAADGGMMASIATLKALHQVAMVESGRSMEECEGPLEEALKALDTEARSLVATGHFEVPLGKSTLSQAYLRQLGAFQAGLGEYVEVRSRFDRLLHQYSSTATSFLDLISQAQSNVEARTDSFVAGLAPLSASVRARILGALGFGVVLALVAGVSLTVSVSRKVKSIVGDVSEIERDMKLAKRLHLDSADELGVIASTVNSLLSEFERSIQSVSGSSRQLGDEAMHISAASQHLSAASTEQAASIESLASNLKDLVERNHGNLSNTEAANEVSSKASSAARAGVEQMREVISAMEAIDESSQRAAQVISIIDGIAFQTNLLALNAAVEAARAGEAGKGFAVVAEEVRSLAQRSVDAAKDTSQILSDSRDAAERGFGLARSLADTFDTIVQEAGKVSDLLSQVASDSRVQADSFKDISIGLRDLDAVMKANLDQSVELESTARRTTDQVVALSEQVGRFS